MHRSVNASFFFADFGPETLSLFSSLLSVGCCMVQPLHRPFPIIARHVHTMALFYFNVITKCGADFGQLQKKKDFAGSEYHTLHINEGK